MAGKNYCPECGNRLKYFKCHVCGFNAGHGSTVIVENPYRKMRR